MKTNNMPKRLLLTGFSLALLCLAFGVRFAAMQTPDLNAPVVIAAPAPAAQFQPQISRGANSSLIVWADQRNVISRFTSRDANEVGSVTDIYAARYDAGGNLADTTPIIVAQQIYEQTLPQVAWNGQNWLVAWITERQNNPFAQDVVAVRVAPDGRILDAAPIVIGVQPSSSSTNPSYLSVASDGSNWVVVWGTGTYQSQIHGARITPDGSLLDIGGNGKVLFDDAESFSAPGDAHLAFVGNQFLLVWDRVTDGGNGIRAQRFNQNLDAVDAAPFVVNQFAGSNATAPRVASDGANYFVIWREDRFAYNEIFGTRISAAGQVLDVGGIKVFGAPGDYVMPRNTALTWDGASYVAAFHARLVDASGESILAARITSEGAISAPVIISDETGATQPAVAPAFPNGTQIVWTDRRLSADGDIFTAALAPNSTVSAATPASLGAPRQTRPRFAVTATGNFTIVFRSTISGASSIFLQRLNSSGNAIDAEPILITSGAENIINPSIAFNGANYLVVWELNGTTYGRRVGSDGVPAGAEFLISTGNQPDVAALGTNFLVVNSFPRTTQLRHIQSTVVGGDGTVNAPVRIGNNFDLDPRVRAFGNRWLVVWESNASHDNPDSNIAAAFVNADGTSPGEFSIAGIFSDNPHFAVAGNTALVVWERGGNIEGRRISADGTFPDNFKILADANGSLYHPAIAWDGARFVLAYADPSRRTSLPPADVWATLIGIDNTVLTLGGFPVADSPLSEEQPTVEAFNGTTLFGFAKFEDRAPFAAFRVKLRRFPFDRDFFVAAAPFARTIAPGATTTFTISVTANNNFNQAVNLSVDGLPNGATAIFTPSTIPNGNGSAVLTIVTAPDTPENIYPLTINAASGAQHSQTRVSLLVDDNPPTTGFAVANLGTFGGSQSEARAINDNGQIVGWAFNAAQKRRAFLYSNGQMSDLGTFGGTESFAYDINNSGQIVGWAKNASNYERAFLANGAALQDLGTLGGDRSFAYAINNAGQITGSAEVDTGNNNAFLYQNGAMQNLGVINGYYSYGFGINSAGKVVGVGYVDGQNAGQRGFIRQNNAFTVLPTLGGSDSIAFAINDGDQVVGTAGTDSSNVGYRNAFLYQNGQMLNLGNLGATASEARDINNAGNVVGSIQLTAFGTERRAFLYDGTQMRNLNALIPADSGWVLNEAFSINNAGNIVGRGTFNNQPRAFLLSPATSQNTPPNVQITSPATANNFGETTAITITAAAFDADGAVARVEFYADANLIGTSTSNPYAVLWTGIPNNRTYTLTAKAFDNAGAATISAPVTITVGNPITNSRTKFDFDGDGKADYTVFRPSDRVWYVLGSQTGYTAAQFGLTTDKLTPADFDGDGRTDIAVFRDGVWFWLSSSNGAFNSYRFGIADDVPVPADYTGDGRAELAVFRGGVWYTLDLSNNQFQALQFGIADDKPVPADFDGDGRTDLAVYRNGVWYHLRSSDSGFRAVQFGIINTDKPVVGDYDGDGRADYAVYRSGEWLISGTTAGIYGVQWGVQNDVPTPADYDGDGKIDVAVFRDGNWYWLTSANNQFRTAQLGVTGDRPIPAAYLLP